MFNRFSVIFYSTLAKKTMQKLQARWPSFYLINSVKALKKTKKTDKCQMEKKNHPLDLICS